MTHVSSKVCLCWGPAVKVPGVDEDSSVERDANRKRETQEGFSHSMAGRM